MLWDIYIYIVRPWKPEVKRQVWNTKLKSLLCWPQWFERFSDDVASTESHQLWTSIEALRYACKFHHYIYHIVNQANIFRMMFSLSLFEEHLQVLTSHLLSSTDIPVNKLQCLVFAGVCTHLLCDLYTVADWKCHISPTCYCQHYEQNN